MNDSYDKLKNKLKGGSCFGVLLLFLFLWQVMYTFVICVHNRKIEKPLSKLEAITKTYNRGIKLRTYGLSDVSKRMYYVQ